MNRVSRATTSGDIITSSHVVASNPDVEADVIAKSSLLTEASLLASVSTWRKTRSVWHGRLFTTAIGQSPNNATL